MLRYWGIHLAHGGHPFIIHGYLMGFGVLSTGDTGETYMYDDNKLTAGQSKVNFDQPGIGWVDIDGWKLKYTVFQK